MLFHVIYVYILRFPFILFYFLNIARNSGAANTAMRKLAVSLADSSNLRVILSVFYIIVEVMRCTREDDTDEYKQLQEEFRTEICKSTYRLCTPIFLI